MNCYVRSANARRGKIYGYKIDPISGLILKVSDPFIHDEFEFSKRYSGKSFSSTMQDGDKGTRFKDIGYTRLGYWDTIEIPMTDEQEDAAHLKACEIEGLPYDLIGVASLTTDLNIIKPNKDKYWCSETVATLLIAGGVELQYIPEQYTPTELFFELLYRAKNIILGS